MGPDEKVEQPIAETMAGATQLDRRAFLVRARKQIADVIDEGVPPHALARLIAEMDRLDVEVRRMDASAKQERERQEGRQSARRSFDQTAI
ncbi:hypothetical protein C5C63_04520 [Rathayibacter sp. AY1B8]|nr:hypothetical protein C5C63_04520 [Rathayibacter sp. AY1B8]